VVAVNEPEALEIALRDLKSGDVVAMMCIETGPQSRARLEELGGKQLVAPATRRAADRDAE
jgi:hypothetical protein